MIMVDSSGLFDLKETLAVGLYFAVIGYFFLMFGYFLLIRYRRSKRIYWFYFSMFFIFLAISRVAYMFYDFFFIATDTMNRFAAWKVANVTGWIAVAALSGILSILLFTGDSPLHKWVKRIFPLVPLGLGIHIFFLPIEWVFAPGIPIAKLYLNYIILPAYIFLLPVMFFYLSWRSVGTLARSFLLNGLGLFLYYGARAVQGDVLVWIFGGGYTAALLPPLVILLSILLISFANQYEHLK